MKFIQYIHPWVMWGLSNMGVKPVEFEFCSLEEFLRHPHIRIYTTDDNFKKFNLCRGSEYELISVLKNGRTCKIGVLDGDITEIPEWNPQIIIPPGVKV